MRTQDEIRTRIPKSALLLTMVVTMSACAGFLGSTSWKEEVLLHDGQKIIVERSQSYGGRHEIGQSSPVKEHTITFSQAGSSRAISWTSVYGADLGRANFNLLALHILNSTPYLVVEPNLCLSYNKWGRPNPPYVIFKHDGNEWQRIPFSELPPEFKTINLIVNNGREEDIKAYERKRGFVTSENVKEINSSLTQPEYKTLLRESIRSAAQGCSEMIRVKDGWEGTGFFSRQSSKEACFKYCERKEVSAQACPCNRLFKER